MTTALIDGDIIAYQSAAASEKELDWGDGAGPETTANADEAIETALKSVRQWAELAGCGDILVCFSDRDGQNFRRGVFPAYKAHRRKPKPIAYWNVVAAMEDAFQIARIPTLEADDVMGLHATQPGSRDVIVSTDKDMRTVPARVFNPVKSLRPEKIGLADADRFWMTQTLTGDATDGYPGLPGIGPKKAEKILDLCPPDLPGMWRGVLDAYLRNRLTEHDALTQARLARILRHGDYSKDTGKVRLWSPN